MKILTILMILNSQLSFALSCPKIYVASYVSDWTCQGCSKRHNERALRNYQTQLKKAGYIVVQNENDADTIAVQELGSGFVNGKGTLYEELVLMLFDKSSGEIIENETIPFIRSTTALGYFFYNGAIRATKAGVGRFKGCN